MQRRSFSWIVRIRFGKEAMTDNARLGKAWERDLNGSMDGSSKSFAVVQREMGPASTVFGGGLYT